MPTDRSSSPLLPGFDFLKNLASQAGKGLEGLQQLNTMGQSLGGSMASGMGAGLGGLGGLGSMNGFKQWVAPTLDPDELEKRIEELRTVQFWLEQNARLLGATIQALEVQKMTLSTLRSMDVKLPDLQQVLGAMMPQSTSAQGRGSDKAEEPTRTAEAAAQAAGKSTAQKARKPASDSSTGSAAGTAGAGAQVDPMRWWGALTEQFQQLATQALATTTASASAGTAGAKPARRAPARGDSPGTATTDTRPGRAAKRASPNSGAKTRARINDARPRRT